MNESKDEVPWPAIVRAFFAGGLRPAQSNGPVRGVEFSEGRGGGQRARPEGFASQSAHLHASSTQKAPKGHPNTTQRARIAPILKSRRVWIGGWGRRGIYQWGMEWGGESVLLSLKKKILQ